MTNRIRGIVTLFALAHLVVLVGHGAAHMHFQVPMPAWHMYYIIGVIWIAPISGASLLWTRYRAAGVWLFTGAMAGAFVFGCYYHFVKAGPDNVSEFPFSGWGALFTLTAVFLAVIEAAAVGATASALRGRYGASRPASV